MKDIHYFPKAFLFSIILMLISSLVYADTLQAVIHRTAYNNPTVLSFRENRLAADNAVKVASGGYYPSIKALAAYGPQTSRNSNTISGGGNSQVTMPVTRAGLSLTQNVFSGFETTGEVARNKARANSAAYQLLANMQDTVNDIAKNYIEVLQAKALVRLAQNNLNAHEKLYRMVKLRIDAGLSNQADYIQTSGRLALAESQLIAEKNNLQNAIARYKRATGEYPENLSLPNDIPDAALPQSEAEAIKSAVAYYPVVKSAQADVVQAGKQHEVSKAPNYPRLEILADINRNQNEGGQRGPSYDQAVFLQASYDILAGGAQVARQKETVHLLYQANEIMHNSARQAAENAKISWNTYYSSKEVLPMLKKHRDATTNTVAAYQDQFKLGKRTLFDRLDVQSELYSANRDYVSGQYRILIAKYQLLHSMGILLQAMRLELPAEVNTYRT